MTAGERERLGAPTWDNFREFAIGPGNAQIKRLGEGEALELFVEAGASGIGLRVLSEEGGKPVESALELLSIHGVVRRNRPWIELVANDEEIFECAFYFFLKVAENAMAGMKAAVAIEDALQSWAKTLARASRLSKTQQIGLLGELWVLDRLVGACGPTAVEAWLGPAGERHDYRLDRDELEVKTTTRRNRVHTMNGLQQALPSKGCRLYVVSLLLEAAGGMQDAFSLPSLVKRVSERLVDHQAELERFEELLSAERYRRAEAAAYSDRYVLAEPAALVPVDEHFPRITDGLLRTAIGELASRVGQVSYEVQLDGLGHPDGTAEFLRLLPPAEE